MDASPLVAAAFVVAVTAVGACSSDSDDAPAGSDASERARQTADQGGQSAALGSIPSPNAAQGRQLVARLDAVAPGLASEPGDTIDNARNVCTSILGGARSLVESTRLRFVGDGVEHMTADQARRVIRAIRHEAWCMEGADTP